MASSAPSPLHSPSTLQILDTAAQDLHHSIALKTQHIGRLQHDRSKPFSLSQSAAFSQGILTPITPTFSPTILRSNNPYKHIKSSLSVSIAPVSDLDDMDDMQSRATQDEQHTYFASSMDIATPSSAVDMSGSGDASPAPSEDRLPLLASSPAHTDSPALGSATQRASYAMLSNMPTPPLSHSSNGLSPASSSDCESYASCIETLPAANYLASLIPLSASAFPASISHLQSFMEYFPADLTTVACAGIILDTLSPKAIRAWRNKLAQKGLWNDCAESNKGELLVLVAVALAHGWFNDEEASTRNFALARASGHRFTAREIHITKIELLVECEYNFMGLFANEEVEWAMRQLEEERERCFGKQDGKMQCRYSVVDEEEETGSVFI